MPGACGSREGFEVCGGRAVAVGREGADGLAEGAGAGGGVDWVGLEGAMGESARVRKPDAMREAETSEGRVCAVCGAETERRGSIAGAAVGRAKDVRFRCVLVLGGGGGGGIRLRLSVAVDDLSKGIARSEG